MYKILAGLFLLLTPGAVWAAETSTNSTSNASPIGFFGLLLLYVCYRRRKEAIGGWLFYYFATVVLASIVWIIGRIINISDFNPSLWEDKTLYALFLVSAVPGSIFFIAQVIVSFLLYKKMDWKYVSYLKYALMFQLIFSIGAIFIDTKYFTNNIPSHIISSVISAIWLIYFSKSIRVRSVFLEKNWNSYVVPEPNRI